MMRTTRTRLFLRSTPSAFFRCDSSVSTPRILITGGLGQVGTDLAAVLRDKYGIDNVIVTDINKPSKEIRSKGHFKYLNVLDEGAIDKIVVDNDITWVLHLSAIMSVLGEAQPHKAIDLNINGVRNILEVSRRHKLRVFSPSSMAVFGADCGKTKTKDDTILNPSTIYGVTKVTMEQLGTYYHNKFGLDFRCLRYGGVISAPTLPGGGTTDYAIHMFHAALKKEKYVCPVLKDEPLPMVYVDDCIDGTVRFLEAPRETLKRCVYNVDGVSFTPDMLHKAIERQGLALEMSYEKGIAQDIAFSWPDSMEDSNARKDWGWDPKYDTDRMSAEMIRLIPTMHDI